METMMRFIWALITLVGLSASCTAALAMQAKDLAVVPTNPQSVVKLTINIDKPTVVLGETVSFTFSSSKDGYATLWNLGTSGKAQRIFPNRLGGNMRVKAGRSYGAGGVGDRFTFQATGKVGMEDVYLVWTRMPHAQPKDARFLDTGALTKDLVVVQQLPSQDWATAKVTYEIVPTGYHPTRGFGPANNSPGPVIEVGGDVYIVGDGF